MKHYVLGFAFNAIGSHVVLIEKQKPDWQRHKWNGVGGKVEFGEIPERAMEREFYEETDTKILNWQQFGEMLFPAARVDLFRVHVNDLTVRQTTDEPPRIFRVDQLPHRIIPNLKWIIPLALDYEYYANIKGSHTNGS